MNVGCNMFREYSVANFCSLIGLVCDVVLLDLTFEKGGPLTTLFTLLSYMSSATMYSNE